MLKVPAVCMMYGHTYVLRVGQPRKVVNPTRGQLNREEILHVVS